jgi:hypothetical protein
MVCGNNNNKKSGGSGFGYALVKGFDLFIFILKGLAK